MHLSLILLDSSGNIKLDASGNIRVGADSDPCCCGICSNSNQPEMLTVTFSGLTNCCIIGIGVSFLVIDSFNGTFDLPYIGIVGGRHTWRLTITGGNTVAQYADMACGGIPSFTGARDTQINVYCIAGNLNASIQLDPPISAETAAFVGDSEGSALPATAPNTQTNCSAQLFLTSGGTAYIVAG